MKKILLFVGWFNCTILLLLLSFRTYNTLNDISRVKDINRLTKLTVQKLAPKNAYQMYTALPQSMQSFAVAFGKKDARPEIIRSYLKESPLSDYADAIVAMGDNFGVNPYLVIAIGECESNNGRKIPSGSYNAWGLGIPTGATSGINFANWEEGLNAEFRFLKKLIDKGLTTPDLMGPVYAPPSVQNGGSWANCVNHFLNNLK
jgi:hypothetical protein